MTPTAPMPVELLVDKKKWKGWAGRLARFTADYEVKVNGEAEEGGVDVFIDLVTIPTGFVTDGASIPWFLWSILPPFGPYLPAAAAHDFLYFAATFSRKGADQIFLRIMEDLEVPLWKRRIMYRGVRVGGWWGWRKHRRRSQPHGEGMAEE